MGRWMIAITIGAGLATSALAEQPRADLERCLLERPELAAFSGIVAVTRGGQSSVMPRGAMAAPGSPPITAETRFNIGSAGKMFTAVAIGQLIDAGRVSLDDPVGRYVEGLTPEAAKVTIRQLLAHTGGLGNFFTPAAAPKLQHLTAMSELLPLIASENPAFEPGSRFEYSNSGFALLGLVVERASGETYGGYLERHIFAPAGMNATGLSFEEGSTAVGATGGEFRPQRLPPPRGAAPPPGPVPQGSPSGTMPPPPSARPGPGMDAPPAGGPLRPSLEARLPATPAGGLYSSAGDLTLFFQALGAGKLLKPETMRSFTQRQVDSAPARGELPALFYGFGFGTGSFNGHRWFGHNGGAPGLNAEAIMFPEDELIIIVLAHRDPPSASLAFRAVRDALLQKRAC